MTIAQAREAYRGLRDRALALPSTQLDDALPAYINELWKSWDDTLAGLPDEAAYGVHIEWLTTTIRDPRLDEDAVVQWLDAYPDAINDHRPGGLFNPVSA